MRAQASNLSVASGDMSRVRGDTKAQLVDAYMEKRAELRRFLLAHFKDAHKADDVLQEIYLKIQRTKLTAPIDNRVAFLFRIANNLALDHRRRIERSLKRDHKWHEESGHFLGSEPVYDGPDADARIDAKAKISKIIQLVRQLPPQCAKVFVAHKLEGLSHAEVAERLEISRSTVEKHMGKALRYLAKHLDE